ncbi:unnamed protein product [Camellia sinensis]
MKFGKRLKQQVQETLPGWHDKFLSYKDLKKLVRLISSAPPMMNGSLEFGKAEAEFMYLLNNEIEKFNSFFMEQEEDFVIRHKELQQRIETVTESWGPNGSQPSEMDYKEEMGKIRKEIVNFHGEMVLLMNYSNINYTGLAKILKKYDKRTGGLLRSLFIQNVLQQPFYTTDLISKLVKECESTIDAMFPVVEEEEGIIRGEREVIMVSGEGVFRNTVAALLTMQEIRRGSSTYGHFSLPPLNLPDSDFIQELQQRIETVTESWGPNGSQPSEMDYKEEMGKIRKEIVNFHGEMVLLMNYSNINYTGLAKILKKYDKRTGGLLRSPFIQNVLQQPFYTTDLISKLVKECESTIDAMFPVVEEEEGIIRGEREVIMVSGEGVFRNTVAALLTMQEIRRGSSTYGHFSLPPLNLPDSDFIQELQQRIETVTESWGPNGSQPSEMDYKEEMGKIRKEIVNFHGEMVLLMNYSNINYTGLAKILKKYDKRTGGLLRSPFIQNVLQQPFYTTDLISKLVKECESTIDAMFPVVEEEEGIIRGEREVIMVSGEGVFRNTVAALLTMQEIRRGSSTYGHFSLPPLNLPDSDFIQAFQLNSPIPIP